jgi:hypothetical protein
MTITSGPIAYTLRWQALRPCGDDRPEATNPEGCGPSRAEWAVAMTTYHVRAGDTIIVDPEPVTPPPLPPTPDPFTVSDAAFSAAMVAEVNKRRASGWQGVLANGIASTLPPVGPLLADPDLFKAAVASVTDSAQTGPASTRTGSRRTSARGHIPPAARSSGGQGLPRDDDVLRRCLDEVRRPPGDPDERPLRLGGLRLLAPRR